MKLFKYAVVAATLLLSTNAVATDFSVGVVDLEKVFYNCFQEEEEKSYVFFPTTVTQHSKVGESRGMDGPTVNFYRTCFR